MLREPDSQPEAHRAADWVAAVKEDLVSVQRQVAAHQECFQRQRAGPLRQATAKAAADLRGFALAWAPGEPVWPESECLAVPSAASAAGPRIKADARAPNASEQALVLVQVPQEPHELVWAPQQRQQVQASLLQADAALPREQLPARARPRARKRQRFALRCPLRSGGA